MSDPILAIQGSPEWHAARLGRVTASRFADILTEPRSAADKKAGNLSATAQSYLLDLVAETLTGQCQGFEGNKATQWGNDNEPAAVEVYEAVTGHVCHEVGFVEHPVDALIGGSPDRLIAEDGGLEIKCPFNTRVHLGYLLDGALPREYEAQVQGLLWITGREWWDFVSYDPRIPDVSLSLFCVRVERDELFIRDLERKTFAFAAKLADITKNLLMRSMNP